MMVDKLHAKSFEVAILHWNTYSQATVRGANSINIFFFLLINQNWPLLPEESLEQGRNASRRLKSIYSLVIKSLFIL